MKKFHYRGHATGRKINEGVIEAESETQALKLLMQQGIRPFEIGSARRDGSSRKILAQFRSKFRFARFFRDLETLMNAGFTVDTALGALINSGLPSSERGPVQEVHKNIRRGAGVAESFSILPDLPAGIAPLLESGESSGRLERVMAAIAADLEAADAQKAAFIQAIAYPIFLLSTMILALGLITFYLVPSLTPIFDNADTGKPVMLAIFGAINDWVTGNPGLLAVSSGCCIALAFLFGRNGRWKLWFDRAAGRLPLVGAALHKKAIARYLAALALLSGQGVPIARSMDIAARTCPNMRYVPLLHEARRHVLEGGHVVEGLRRTKLFNEATLGLLHVGEEANRLPDLAERAASLLQKESAEVLQRLMRAMTPAITIFMGSMIGGLVISVMSAIFAINDMALK